MADKSDDRESSPSGAVVPQGFVGRLIARLLQWKIVRAYLLFSERRGQLLSDAVTYQALFSVFAAVLFGFSVAGLWLRGNPEAWNALITGIDSVVPGLVGTGDDALVNPDSIAIPTGLTLTGIVSLLGIGWSSFAAIGSLRQAMRAIGDQGNDDIMFVWTLARNIGVGVGIGVGLLISVAVTFLGTAFLGTVGDWLGLDSADPILLWGPRLLAILVTFLLDAAIVAVAFLLLSGMRPRARTLWSGALLGAVGLIVLQQLSGLFVGGASNNPLLATFASLIALLLWFNLSTQVILISTAYIVTGVRDDHDRVRSRFGAQTFAQRRVQQAELVTQVAADDLRAAREAEREEREKLAAKAAKAAEKAEKEEQRT